MRPAAGRFRPPHELRLKVTEIPGSLTAASPFGVLRSRTTERLFRLKFRNQVAMPLTPARLAPAVRV